MKYTQKGAMFGLDARIALAIFGALSVITGAALFSAIQDSKVVSILTEMDNIDKAITSYYLDTGVYLAVFPGAGADSGNGGLLILPQLINKTGKGWLGPYLTFKKYGVVTLEHSKYGQIVVFRQSNANWLTPGDKDCTVGSDCSIFICYDDIPDDLNKALDVKIDGVSTGADSGKFRYGGGMGCKKGSLYSGPLTK